MIRNRIDSIIKGSSKATCGMFERQIVVSAREFPRVLAELRRKGKHIVGFSPPGRGSRTIWFTDRGIGLL